MNGASAQPLRAFLGSAALQARYLARAREIAAFNAALQQRQAAAPAAARGPTVSTSRDGASVPAASMPSMQALQAAMAADQAAVPALSMPAAAQPATQIATGTAATPHTSNSNRLRGLWSPDEVEAPDFFAEQLGLPKALADLLGDFALSLPPHRLPTFPVEAVEAIVPSADLARVAPAFIAWMFDDPASGALALEIGTALCAASQAVAALHAREAAGSAVPRSEWLAARKALHAIETAAGSDADARVKLFSSDTAWSCASTRSVATQGWRVWHWDLASLQVQQAIGYSDAELAAFGRLRDAFWAETTELRREMQAAGTPQAQYEAVFIARHPDAARRHADYARRTTQASQARATQGADRLLALLRAAQRG